jgi:hypothetical protein
VNLSVLAHLLVTERHRQRAAPAGGFSVPFLSEREVPPEVEPMLVTDARGRFVPTRRSHEGLARFGFSACSLECEPILLGRLYDSMVSLSVEHGWNNQFSTMSDAIDFMRASPFKPKNLVISEDLVSQFTTDESGGLVGSIDGIRVLSAKLPLGAALLFTAPPALGVYVRIGDYLGLQIYNIRQSVAVVKVNGMG